MTFGAQHLGQALAHFAAEHPRVELDVSLDDRVIDLVGGGYDLALRIGRLRDSALIARRLAPIRGTVVASPYYLERLGEPMRPSELENHDLLFYANVGVGDQWRFRVGSGWQTIRGKSRFRADNGELLREAAIAGLGIAVLPSFIASPAIRSGALQVILRDHPVEESALFAVMPPGRSTTARVRALVDFLSAHFGPEPAWDPCWLAERDGTVDKT